MSILFIGDTHGKFDHILPVVQRERPEAIIFVGDIEPPAPFENVIADLMVETECYWIPGNHETDNRNNYEFTYNSGLADRNLHGKVTEIAGVRVAALGGTFNGEIWMPDPISAPPKFDTYEEFAEHIDNLLTYREISQAKHTGLALKHRSAIFWKDWYDLYGLEADIFVSHEAPSCHPNGYQMIDELARSMGVKKAFHGHHHDSLDYSQWFKELGFSAYGVGKRGIANEDGIMLLAGEMDDARMHRKKSRIAL